MKNVYTTIIAFSFLFLMGCSKDFLKSYENCIVGTWRITDVNRAGIGGNTDHLPFKQGTLILMMMGALYILMYPAMFIKAVGTLEKNG